MRLLNAIFRHTFVPKIFIYFYMDIYIFSVDRFELAVAELSTFHVIFIAAYIKFETMFFHYILTKGKLQKNRFYTC